MNNSIDTASGNRTNNFDLFRLIAALMVMFSHSFSQITSGPVELLYKWTGHRYFFSSLGLMIFFSISGYLVTMSLLLTDSVKKYAWKRFLRIYPAYIVVTLLIVFLLGPFFTTFPLSRYFSSQLTWKYLYQNIFIFDSQRRLPGVFGEKDVNPSAWTLSFELKLYMCLLVFYLLKFFKYRWLQAFVFIIALCFKATIPFQSISKWTVYDLHAWYSLGFFFLTGSTLYVWRDIIKLDYRGILLLGVAWCIGELLNFAVPALETIFICYTILWLCIKAPLLIKPRADLSYGIYIYACPVQFIVTRETHGSLSLWPYNAITLSITVLLAFFSWHLIERKALSYKNKIV